MVTKIYFVYSNLLYITGDPPYLLQTGPSHMSRTILYLTLFLLLPQPKIKKREKGGKIYRHYIDRLHVAKNVIYVVTVDVDSSLTGSSVGLRS